MKLLEKFGDCAFLFPGQGAQSPGMAVHLWKKYDAVKRLFTLASNIWGRDALALLRNSSAEALKQTENAQPALVLAGLSYKAALEEHGIKPAACAGHSLGEYPAFAAAGILSEADCLKLAAERGRIFAECASLGGGMAAVLGLPPETVEALVKQWADEGLSGLYAANFNSPRQTVVSGAAEALAEAEARFKAAGAKRIVPLAVSGPFHSPLMEEAARRFADVLAPVVFADPRTPFFSNVTGKQVSSGAQIKQLAALHITSPVRWTDIEEGIAALGITSAIECGQGKTLAGLWKDFSTGTNCISAEEVLAASAA